MHVGTGASRSPSSVVRVTRWHQLLLTEEVERDLQFWLGWDGDAVLGSSEGNPVDGRDFVRQLQIGRLIIIHTRLAHPRLADAEHHY